MKNVIRIVILILVMCLSSCRKEVNIREWVSSVSDAPWLLMSLEGGAEWEGTASRSVTVHFDIGKVSRSIEGFGGQLDQKGWQAIACLSPEDRAAVLRELFVPGAGGNLAVCRISIGANQNDLESSSYDETDADFDLRHFSVAQDERWQIPYIKEILSQNPGIRLWAFPYTLPSWMRCDSTWMTDELYLQTYVSYFCRFVDEYRLRGIGIHGILLNCESELVTGRWMEARKGEGLEKFLHGLLPEMQKRNVVVDTTEANREKNVGPAWAQLKRWLKRSARGGCDWMVAGIDNVQNQQENSLVSLVKIDTLKRSYHFTAEYYLLKHLSHYVVPGAYLLEPGEDSYQDALAFVNPDKEVVVVAANPRDESMEILLEICGERRLFKMQPHSFHTWLCN